MKSNNMENNKPDWLKAFETDAQEFNDSKYVGYTDGQIAQINALDQWRKDNPEEVLKQREHAWDNGFRNSEVQSKLGIIGGANSVISRQESGFFESEEWRESQSKGGKTQGPKNVESGHWARIQPAATAASHTHVTCPKCGFTGSLRNIKPIHFDNCINPDITNIIGNYIGPNEEVSIKVLGKQIANHLEVGVGRVETLLKRDFLIPGIQESRYPKWRLK